MSIFLESTQSKSISGIEGKMWLICHILRFDDFKFKITDAIQDIPHSKTKVTFLGLTYGP